MRKLLPVKARINSFKAHRLVYHSTLGWRVIKKKKKTPRAFRSPGGSVIMLTDCRISTQCSTLMRKHLPVNRNEEAPSRVVLSAGRVITYQLLSAFISLPADNNTGNSDRKEVLLGGATLPWTARKNSPRRSNPSGSEAGSYLRPIDSCITQLKAQGLVGPVTRVKKKKKKTFPWTARRNSPRRPTPSAPHATSLGRIYG